MECEREGYYGLSHDTVSAPFFTVCTSFLSDYTGKITKLYIADFQLFVFLELQWEINHLSDRNNTFDTSYLYLDGYDGQA